MVSKSCSLFQSQRKKASGNATSIVILSRTTNARFAIVSIRTSKRGIAYGVMEEPADPDDLIMFRSLLEAMLAGTYWR